MMSCFIQHLPTVHLPSPGLAGLLSRWRPQRPARREALPLLLVRSETRHVYKRILVASDLSGSAQHAARLALLAGPSAQLVFLQALHAENEAGYPSDRMQQQCMDARARLERMLGQLDIQGRLVSFVVQRGEPQALLVRYAQRMQADLIVIGAKNVFRPGACPRRAAVRMTGRSGCDILLAIPELAGLPEPA